MKLLNDRFLKRFKKGKHQFKKIHNYMAFADFNNLQELEQEKKWWKIVGDQVEAVFSHMEKEFKHRYMMGERIHYAHAMYEHMFNLYMSPSDLLLEHFTDPIDYIPMCPFVEINLDRCGENRFTNVMYQVFTSAIFYLTVVAKVSANHEPVQDCSDYGEYNLIPFAQFISKLDDEPVEIMFLGEKTFVDLKARYKQYLRWIGLINLKISKKLRIQQPLIEAVIVEHNESFNLIIRRKV